MSETFDWTSFYKALCAKGPLLLTGMDEGCLTAIVEMAAHTDEFWCDGLEDVLAMGAGEGDLRAGVVHALEIWRENVVIALDEHPYCDADTSDLRLELETPEAEAIIEELVEAARV